MLAQGYVSWLGLVDAFQEEFEMFVDIKNIEEIKVTKVYNLVYAVCYKTR